MAPEKNKFFAFLLLSMLVISNPSFAVSCEAKSGIGTVALLELYTSEGCSSCPPADKWIAELPKRNLDLDRVVPLALHVDYWNQLGWNDRFSQAAFTQRQRDFGKRTNALTVYTPEFVLSGREYRRWYSGNFTAEIEQINRIPSRANIALRAELTAKQLRITSTASVKQVPANAGLYLALYESNLSTNVGSGENSGRRLLHSSVVRQLAGPFTLNGKGQVRVDEVFQLKTDWEIANLGIAAFVQNLQGTEVLQTLALKLCQ